MDALSSEASLEILADLNHRIRRLEYYVTGALELEEAPKDETGSTPNIYTRLKTIENAVNRLASQRRVIDDMLSLYSKYSELFPRDTLIPASQSNDEEVKDSELTSKEQLTSVNACAPMFPSAMSRLHLMKDLPVPPAAATASLLSVKPRLSRAETVQDIFASDIAELRLRSVLLLQRWTKVSVQAAGYCWADWEERLIEVHKIVQRAEFAKAQDQK